MDKAENKTYYLASNNEETFGAPKAETVEGAISEAVEYYDLKPGDTVYVGEIVDYGNGEAFYPSADDIVNWLAERAGDNAGEFAEDWLSDVTGLMEIELTAILEIVIRDWIVEHKLQPKFYTVEKVKKAEVGNA